MSNDVNTDIQDKIDYITELIDSYKYATTPHEREQRFTVLEKTITTTPESIAIINSTLGDGSVTYSPSETLNTQGGALPDWPLILTAISSGSKDIVDLFIKHGADLSQIHPDKINEAVDYLCFQDKEAGQRMIAHLEEIQALNLKQKQDENQHCGIIFKDENQEIDPNETVSPPATPSGNQTAENPTIIEF